MAEKRFRPDKCKSFAISRISVEGANALIIDDILETGETLTRIRELIEERGAASVRVATLLHKEGKLKRPLTADYVGFQIPGRIRCGLRSGFRRTLSKPSRH